MKHTCYLDLLEDLGLECHIRRYPNQKYNYLRIGPYQFELT